jgi:excisionase family DNA binding protein
MVIVESVHPVHGDHGSAIIMARYLTPREVATRLRVSPTTVMRAIHEERLFAVRVSERVYRIPVGALARFERGEPEHIAVPAVDVPELSEPERAEPVDSPVVAGQR